MTWPFYSRIIIFDFISFLFSFNHYLLDFDLADADADLVSIRTLLSCNL